MEVLTDQVVRAWLSDGDGSGLGDGYGYGSGSGNGYGSGLGNGYGSGSGLGDGDGSGLGDGYGYGSGSGDGDGSGLGDGYGLCFGDGSGDGDDGISKIDGKKLYIIDGVPTAILSIHGDVAKGFVLERNVVKRPCFIARGNGQFAHGETIHEACAALQEKLYDGSTEEERISAFHAKFPEYDVPYSNDDLFVYHHILTGSCRMGREQFCRNNGISLDGKTTVRQFIELTKDSYGGEIIAKLPKYYNKK